MRLNNREFNFFLGQKVQQARRMRGIKQEELAKALGFSRIALSMYESGRSKFTVYQLMLISEILNLTIDTFLPEDTTKTEIPKKKHKNYEINTEDDIVFMLEMSLRNFFLSKGVPKKELKVMVEKAIFLINTLCKESFFSTT